MAANPHMSMVTGRIDLHSHLLPGVDDGCAELEESLECVRQLLANGFCGTVCTPHVWPVEYRRNTPGRIAAAVDRLEAKLAQTGLDYKLWPGAEVRIDADAVAWLEEHGVPTLAASRYVLIDWFGYDWPKFGDELVGWLQARGYRPVLAHPERLWLPEPDWTELLNTLQSQGVLLQGNLNSLSGGEGDEAQARGLRLLAEGRYTALALDMHGPDTLPGRFGGIEVALENVGRRQVDELLCERPLEMVGSGNPPCRDEDAWPEREEDLRERGPER